MQSQVVRRAGSGLMIGAVAGSMVLAVSVRAGASVAPTGTQRTVKAVSRYDDQELRWKGCLSRADTPGLPAGYYRLECATMIAPRDWTAPGAGADLRIKVSRLRSTKATDPQMLFTNPGGPGAGGIDLPLLMVSAQRKKLMASQDVYGMDVHQLLALGTDHEQRKKLMASQDVYGMDVRGTGGSSNLTCGGVQSLTVDPRERSDANVGLMLDAAALTARACDVSGDELRKYVTTAQTVQDVDLLRRVVGQKKVNWLGFSAGTWMGAHYATTFPQQVGRMVFDSNTEFTSTWEAAFTWQPLGFQRRFESDFAPWVAKHHSVYGLGTSKEAVLTSYERLRSKMTPDAPVQDAVMLDDVIAGSMYAKALFPDAAAGLADLNGYLKAQSSGRYRAAEKLAGQVRTRVAALRRTSLRSFSADADPSVFLAVTCQDTPWTGNRAELAEESAAAGQRYPLIGWATIDQPCVFWNRGRVARPATPTGKGVPPVLMVQSEHDPATPIEGARRAAARFQGARLLTVTGEGDHGLYAGGNDCVDRAVDGYLLKGALPAEGATCEGTPMPEPGWGTMRVAAVPGRTTNPLLALRQIGALISR